MIELELDSDLSRHRGKSKVFLTNDAPVTGGDNRPLDDVPQFPDISRPVVLHECPHGILGELFFNVSMKAAHIEEVICN